jgi:hypothetical protein
MARLLLASGCVALAALATVPAAARITEIRVDTVEPLPGSQTLGAAGAYVRIKGIAKGEVDPTAPENAVITNIDKAPRNEAGLVEYETDFYILRPADPAKGSGVLFYEVTNRGRKLLSPYIHDAAKVKPSAANDPQTVDDVGNGFALKRGYTIVWSGWDPDAPKTNNGMTARLPVATEGGMPIVKRIREEIVVGTRGPATGDTVGLGYPAASTDTAQARLTMRLRESDPRTEIAAEAWEFVDAQKIRLKGAAFTPVAIYELWYDATQPKVLGLGYAATRDLVSFLRNETKDATGHPNPVMADGAGATGIRHTLALGISQSGRYLRHHIELGMNRDERGRRVFDGVLAHISGAGKVFANHEFGEPGRTATQHEDRAYPENWPPFSAAAATDPLSGKSGSILRGDASDPLLMETNTSTEYWQKGASLIHMDPSGQRDLTLPPDARAYLIAGTQHAGRAGLDTSAGVCANPRNPHSSGPALRALIVALEEWVDQGIAPPASRVPSLADGTAVNAVAMPAIPNLAMAPAANRIGPPSDWIDPPTNAQNGEGVYGTRVPAVDADGNETAGIRLPDIAVPLATFTGWNVYKAAPSELCDRDGSYSPFAKTKAEREAAHDPRPSVAERYGSRAGYLMRLSVAAAALVGQRLLLPEDAADYLKAVETSDRF